MIKAARMKIFLNYTQTISIINSLNLNWGSIIKGTFGVVLSTSGNVNQIYGLNCLLNDEKYAGDSFYIRALINILFPFCFCLGVVFFWLLKFCFSPKNQDFFSKALVTIAITLFFFQSPMINQMTDFLHCFKIEDNSYNYGLPIENCANPKYIFWRNALIIPVFCFYSILLPIITFGYMFQNRNDIYEEHIICKIGFLLNGYKEDKYFW